MALDTYRVTVPVAFLVFTILQANLVDGVQSIAGTTDSPLAYPITPNDSHGIGKRSVSILAKNGDLPYYRNEWNKKLHPGFRGMNLEDKDDTSDVSKRYIGALAREGGFPMGGGKRSSTRFSTASEALPEEAILDAYLAEELQQRLQQREQAVKNGNPENSLNGNLENQEESEYFMEKRGGVGSLARGGYMPTEGRYSNGKRSVAALARSGELLSIGKGNNPDKEGGNVATKRGIGSILRNGGISTIGKIPVYNLGTLSNGKRGIESLARNYALPTILNQEYVNKYDLFDNENDDTDSNQSTESMYEDSTVGDENGDAAGMSFQDEVVKKHLGSFARSYGLRFPNKRNIGSILRNKGAFHYNGKRGFESNEDKYPIYYKRYISSLLKNQKGYLPDKRDFEGDHDLDAEKRHLASILSNKNGKRYLGSIARQGLLSGRNEKRENLEDIIEESSNMKGGYLVDKRSIVESQPTGTTLTHTEDGNTIKGTAEYELRNVASPVSSEVSRKESNGLQSENLSGSSSVHEKQYKEQPSHRQRRSLYSTSDEYAMPVLQNTDLYDWETTDEDDMPNSPEKRFMGRIPNMGRSRPRTGTQTQSPTRRRPRYH